MEAVISFQWNLMHNILYSIAFDMQIDIVDFVQIESLALIKEILND